MTPPPTMIRAILIGLTTLLLTLFGGPSARAVEAPTGSGAVTHAQPRTMTNPCPGNSDALQFFYMNGKYYLYRSKTNGYTKLSHSVSSYAESGYTSPQPSMSTTPAWVRTLTSSPDHGLPMIWAPDVIYVQDSGEYNMYFTAISKDYGVHCLGVATSTSPTGDFTPGKDPLLCDNDWDNGGTSRFEAIDPSAFLSKTGNLYVLYKADVGNDHGWRIKYAALDASGTDVISATQHVAVSPGSMVESPSLVRHGGKVWLFTSRANYADCSYYTDVWVAPGLGKAFKRSVTKLMSQTSLKSQPDSAVDDSTAKICGPGGADVLSTPTYIAYHVWQGGYGKDSGWPRVTRVARLVWAKDGRPAVQ